VLAILTTHPIQYQVPLWQAMARDGRIRFEVGYLTKHAAQMSRDREFGNWGLVVNEVMACGLPVITTTATAGPDIVTEGRDGWTIEPGNLEALVSTMQFCLENRDQVAEMGISARRTTERFSWDAYGDRWMRILGQACHRLKANIP
jgi:glycosyltransferase involved in cell wall biosynthesis